MFYLDAGVFERRSVVAGYLEIEGCMNQKARSRVSRNARRGCRVGAMPKGGGMILARERESKEKVNQDQVRCGKSVDCVRKQREIGIKFPFESEGERK